MQEFSKEKFLMYVKKDAKTDAYYARAYDSLTLEKKWFYWNGWAAFFSFYWLLYRRMYFKAFVLSALGTLVYFLTIKFNFSFIFPLLFFLAVFGFFGFFGTPLYLYCIRKRMEKDKKIPSPTVDEPVVHWAIWPPFIANILIGFLDISSQTEVWLELPIEFYVLALSLYKHIKARLENIA